MPIDLSAAFNAARQNDVPTLREALKTHDVNSTDDLGRTLLHHAAVALAEESVDFLLLEAEINPNIEDKNGECAGILVHQIWGYENEVALSISNKLLDHSSPFTADSPLGDWPRDPSTGMAMSPFKLRKFYPGFLETVDGDDELTSQVTPASVNAPSP